MMFTEYDRPYIIAEIGANHNGDIEIAKKLIDKAKVCGANCAKFQSWTKESLMSKVIFEDAYKASGSDALEKSVDKYSVSEEELKDLADYCDSIGIDFNSTPFSEKEVDFLTDKIHVKFIKVASMDLNNLRFLAYIAKKKLPVVLSTGLGSLATVCEAVECLKDNGCPEVVLLHCISNYPPEDTDLNLNNIDMFRKTLDVKVGFSDHSIGVLAPTLSMAKGVCIIEKHFTLDKSMDGWDHSISADPAELKVICENAERAYKMLGSYTKKMVEPKDKRDAFQRSIVAANDIKKGQIIQECDLGYKRPGTGLSPNDSRFIVGKEAKRDISYDEIIRFEDF